MCSCVLLLCGFLSGSVVALCAFVGLLSTVHNKVILQIMKSIDSIKTMSGPVYDLGQDSKHSCNEVARTVDRIKTLAYPGDFDPF